MSATPAARATSPTESAFEATRSIEVTSLATTRLGMKCPTIHVTGAVAVSIAAARRLGAALFQVAIAAILAAS